MKIEITSTQMKIEKIFPAKISPYYAKLAMSSDAVKKQSYPNLLEIEDLHSGLQDPTSEEDYSPIPGLIHKYKTKIALLVSDDCFTYCRHCTRKHYVIRKKIMKNKIDMNAVKNYLKMHTEVTDVLLTGGDALFLSDDKLNMILSIFDELPSIKTLRIGTRAIVTFPERITNNFISILQNHKPIWIQTQFNHPDEITPESISAAKLLIKNGFQINNQTVLLKGINDSEEPLVKLFTELICIGIRPYYIYHCDNVCGVRHFITDYRASRKLIESVSHRLPGYAMPRYIIDTPSKFGKMCIELNHVKEILEDGITFEIKSGIFNVKIK